MFGTLELVTYVKGRVAMCFVREVGYGGAVLRNDQVRDEFAGGSAADACGFVPELTQPFQSALEFVGVLRGSCEFDVTGGSKPVRAGAGKAVVCFKARAV